jgi:hypothetical protein
MRIGVKAWQVRHPIMPRHSIASGPSRDPVRTAAWNDAAQTRDLYRRYRPLRSRVCGARLRARDDRGEVFCRIQHYALAVFHFRPAGIHAVWLRLSAMSTFRIFRNQA